jgi:hypothetical protein
VKPAVVLRGEGRRDRPTTVTASLGSQRAPYWGVEPIASLEADEVNALLAGVVRRVSGRRLAK